jgi:meso-butanediol dehydrogenase / (S,S)-butanediol dehydrogenase / diacetyl reductase
MTAPFPRAHAPPRLRRMARDITGSTVLITGAGAGIGAETARRFSAAGARLVLLERDESHAAAIAAELPEATVRTADVADLVAVDAALDGLVGGIDILINNAHSIAAETFAEVTDAQIDRDLAVTLAAPMHLTRRVLPGMLERGHGIVLNVASVNGLAWYGGEAYSAAKAGLIAFTRGLASEYGPRGIRANAVAPGTTATDAWRVQLETDPGLLDRAARWYPLGRVGTPADIASALLWLASPEAAWISGVVLPVDGGLSAGNRLMARDLAGDDPFSSAG